MVAISHVTLACTFFIILEILGGLRAATGFSVYQWGLKKGLRLRSERRMEVNAGRTVLNRLPGARSISRNNQRLQAANFNGHMPDEHQTPPFSPILPSMNLADGMRDIHQEEVKDLYKPIKSNMFLNRLRTLQQISFVIFRSMHASKTSVMASYDKLVNLLLHVRDLVIKEGKRYSENDYYQSPSYYEQRYFSLTQVTWLHSCILSKFRLSDKIKPVFFQDYLAHNASDLKPIRNELQGQIRLVANLYPLLSYSSPVLQLIPDAPVWQLDSKVDNVVSVTSMFYRYHGLAIGALDDLLRFLFSTSSYFFFELDRNVVRFLFDLLTKLIDYNNSFKTVPVALRKNVQHDRMEAVYGILVMKVIT